MLFLKRSVFVATLAVFFSAPLLHASGTATDGQWVPCGWGGGGYYFAAAYHPTQKGVIYMGADVAGVYKTEDNGLHWRFVNNGLANYGVFSLAVDRQSPQVVYAATEGGLCKSLDGGEHWTLLPLTEKKNLRITGEKLKSIRCIAVDPTDSSKVYAASPSGKIYKSNDGGQTWKIAYEKKFNNDSPNDLTVQFGKINGAPFGSVRVPLECPKQIAQADCSGIGFTIRGSNKDEKSVPKQAFLIVKLANNVVYRSKNINECLIGDQTADVVLKASDFAIDDHYAKANPDSVKTLPATPDLSSVKTGDFVATGFPTSAGIVVKLRQFFYTAKRTTDGKFGTDQKPVIVKARDFVTDKTVQAMGNANAGDPLPGTAYSVAVSTKKPSMVAGATDEDGILLSEDGGGTWRALATPKKASSVAFDPTDENVIFGSFFEEGVWKSTDKGKTWVNVSDAVGFKITFKEVAVSPSNHLDVFAIGAPVSNRYGGVVCISNDGGKTWKTANKLNVDQEGDPTRDNVKDGQAGISAPSNIAINPSNAREIFMSTNWRPCFSDDGGMTWSERCRGADITCITDIRFSGKRTYVSAMDEGTFVTENDGNTWRQLWPKKFDPKYSGHNWRLGISNEGGVDRIIATISPWNATIPSSVVLSTNGGDSFDVIRNGLPEYVIKANTMWGTGYPRALAVDPNNPKVVYLGIDGDPIKENNGGGIFKSDDGGCTWLQLPNQPDSRRMFYGLAVDPTDSKRIFWSACGNKGGLYRSEDGGNAWKCVFPNESWAFNMLVAKNGDVYCCGKNLWRSSDHGATWKQLTKFDGSSIRTIVGAEVDPRDSNTIWISAVTWDLSANGIILKTRDGGATWQDITGNIGYNKPIVLRFNPVTCELWAGGVTLHRIKQ